MAVSNYSHRRTSSLTSVGSAVCLEEADKQVKARFVQSTNVCGSLLFILGTSKERPSVAFMELVLQ